MHFNFKVRCHLWDLSGQERFREIIKSYLRGPQGLIITYDCSNRSSFEKVNNWVELIKEYSYYNKKSILVATKVDLEREVPYEEGFAFANANKMLYCECSAKIDYRISEVYYHLLDYIVHEDFSKEKLNIKNNYPLLSTVINDALVNKFLINFFPNIFKSILSIFEMIFDLLVELLTF